MGTDSARYLASQKATIEFNWLSFSSGSGLQFLIGCRCELQKFQITNPTDRLHLINLALPVSCKFELCSDCCALTGLPEGCKYSIQMNLGCKFRSNQPIVDFSHVKWAIVSFGDLIVGKENTKFDPSELQEAVANCPPLIRPAPKYK